MITSLLILGILTNFNVHASTTENAQLETERLLAHPLAVKNAFQIESTLNSGNTEEQPWSGSYWPDLTGSIANHYRSRSQLFNQIGFGLGYAVSQKRVMNDFETVQSSYLGLSEEELNQELSPSEKYDLLIGNTQFDFTQSILDELEFRASHKRSWVSNDTGETQDVDPDDNHESSRFAQDQNKSGSMIWKESRKRFAYWSGICDGWSPASITLPRPVKPVRVVTAQGIPLIFYPDDLKALGTYLFARTNTPYFATMSYAFAGKACKEKGRPNRNPDGKFEAEACNDLDPGVWHLSLANRIGKDRRGFVMDIDNNTKINNHPVFDYRFEYFDPRNGKVNSLKNSMIPIQMVHDTYHQYRNPKTRYLVGVKSTVKIGFYIWPEGNKNQITDSSEQDKTKEIEYSYDLELDQDGNILGGEWGDRSRERKERSKFSHQPDFIWMAPLNQLPYSQMSLSTIKGDFENGTFKWAWDGSGPLPQDWLLAAQADQAWRAPQLNQSNSKLKSAQVLSNIVYVLYDLAKESSR